ncbi:glycosyltransferase [Thiocapsa rosea]|uniref:GT2 family glycosyltransferase n=1 Tax=Thiocapsa rosea TaxID=69360 RepID=A0A495V765_9GAMM|nr:glycosyltransferase [Thiocapsa rosea]RKT44463.1 GT2 family glycosyltransferase [Thiocapsa rosea]
MQLLVLGMHRSGTSVVTRLLNMMGAYFGPEGVSLGANDENPKGFWERRDVLELDESLLRAGGADWDRVADFALDKIPEDAREAFRRQAQALILELDAHRPWVVKEPRLSLLAPLWRDLLEVPVCVYVHRHPIQVAQSLNRRNGFPIAFGLALWERYTLDALRAASDLPTVSVMHRDVMRDPVWTTRTLFEQLESVGVQGLRLPSEREILAFVDPKLFRQTGGADLEAKYISVHQKALADAIENDFPRLLANRGELTMSDGGQVNLHAYEHHIELERSLGEEIASKQELRHELVDQTEHLHAAEQALAERTDQLHRREQDFAEQSEHLRATEQALAERTDQLHRREQDFAEQSEHLRATEQALAERTDQLHRREQDFAEQSEHLRATEQALAERTDQLHRREQDFAEQSEHLRATEQALAERTDQLQRREQDFADQREHLRATEQALAERTDQLQRREQDFADQTEHLRAAEQALAERTDQLQRREQDFADQTERLHHYRDVCDQLGRDYTAVKSSARWKIGNRLVRAVEVLLLRGKPRLVMDEIADTLKALRDWDDAQTAASRPGAQFDSPDVACLREWIGLLDADIRAVLKSKRWTIGNALVRTIEIGIGRRKVPLASEHLRSMLDQAASWVPVGDEHQDLRQLDAWFNGIDQDLRAMLASKRWQVGNSLIGALDRILLRGRRRLVVDHMREVLDQYKTWKDRPPSLPRPSQPSRFDALLADSQLATGGRRQVDVIIPVFNALEDLKRCVDSVIKNDDGTLARLILVNDCSGEDTAAWLREVAHSHDSIDLIEHSVNAGFTKSVNDGIAVSTAPFVISLNSDTIVTRGWMSGLLKCMASGRNVGIVGPLSNAATWQNVPDLYDATHHFANNALPSGMTPDDMALVVAHASAHDYPSTPFINGFCFMIKREVIDSIGLMDEDRFPVGYGEENDYCIRAAEAGFELRIADDVYVFHAESRSFGHERRQELSERGFHALEKKHGIEHFHSLVSLVKDTSAMDRVRGRIGQSLRSFRSWQHRRAVDLPQSIACAEYSPTPQVSGPIPAEQIEAHIILYSDHPGPDLRLTLEALASAPLAPTRVLHLAADWAPGENRFQYDAQFSGRVHHFEDGRGFYAAIKSVLDDIGSAHVCIIRQGTIVVPSVVDALLTICMATSGYAAASPVTNRLSGFAVPLSSGGSALVTDTKLFQTNGERLAAAAPMLDLDVFFLSKQALDAVPFPGFAEDKTDQSLVRFFIALGKRGMRLGILLGRYAFTVSNGPSLPPRAIDAVAELAERDDREDLRHRLLAFRHTMQPWATALERHHPVIIGQPTVCIVVSTLHLYGGVIVLVNWANQLILAGLDVRVYVLHYDGAPARGLRVLFDPKPYSDSETVARELPIGAHIVATIWSTVEMVEDLVERVPGACGYYFIQDYETLFYRDDLSERALRRAAEATYGTRLTKVVTSRWIADQLPAAATLKGGLLHRIPVGIDHSIYPPTDRPGVSDRLPVVVAMARPETPRRGFDLLVDSLAILKSRHPDLRIQLFGSTALAERRIPFAFEDLGTLDSTRLRKIYAEADIFIDTSDFQGFGLCPLEAMALGCSCVLTDSGGVSEYAEHQVNALIVPHSADAVADAVSELINDRALRLRLSSAGVDTARAFDCSRTAREWLRLFAGNQP